ncbi:MAG: hypothetical protein ACLGG2_02950 [Gammaproteobacteria bacterium]
MLRNRTSRRLAAGALIALGAVLMFFATEVWMGVMLLLLGLALEVAGIALERKD